MYCYFKQAGSMVSGSIGSREDSPRQNKSKPPQPPVSNSSSGSRISGFFGGKKNKSSKTSIKQATSDASEV